MMSTLTAVNGTMNMEEKQIGTKQLETDRECRVAGQKTPAVLWLGLHSLHEVKIHWPTAQQLPYFSGALAIPSLGPRQPL